MTGAAQEEGLGWSEQGVGVRPLGSVVRNVPSVDAIKAALSRMATHPESTLPTALLPGIVRVSDADVAALAAPAIRTEPAAALTLGDLTAQHLGRRIRWADGGATYTGRLAVVQHRGDPDRPARNVRTTLTIHGGDGWTRAGTHKATTPVEVLVEDGQP